MEHKMSYSGPEIKIQPEAKTINPDHPSLDRVKAIADIRHDEFTGFTPESFNNLNVSLQVYDVENRPKLDISAPPIYKAASVVSKEKPNSGSGTGVIFFSGALGTASGDIHIPAEIMLKNHDSRVNEKLAGASTEITPQLTFATSLSSSVSKDIADNDSWVDVLSPKSHVETAAYQSAFVIEYLKDFLQKNPNASAEKPLSLVIAGHSLGSQEAVYARPLIEELIKLNNLPIDVIGSILVHPNGLYSQDLPQFVKGLKEYQFPFLKSEIKEKFPSLLDIYEVKAELDDAKEGYDAGLTMRKTRELNEMRHKYSSPQDLTDEQKSHLSEIDSAIETAYFKEGRGRKKEIKKLLKRRYELLAPVVKDWLQTADPRKNDGDSLKSLVAMARATALRKEGRSIRPMPEWVANKQKGEIDIVLASDDHFFPENIALTELSKMESQKKDIYRKENPQASKEELEVAGRYFENAEAVNIARVANWAHHVPATNAPKFGEIITDLMSRMSRRRVENKKELSNNNSKQEQNTYYY